MKTRKYFLIILSLSIWLAGCKEDDGKVVLQGLVVNPTSLEVAANDSKTIAASPLPPNSSDLVFHWTTSKEGVVSLLTTDGPTVWVSGVTQGEVTVTVTCNGESVDIPVTVLPATLKSISVNETAISMLVNNDERKHFELVATTDPVDAINVEYLWSAEPEGIVSFSDTASASTIVTAEKEGEAVITVQSNEVSKKTTFSQKITVTVNREARLDYLRETVAALWKFDDYNDLGKATKGNDLQVNVPGSIRQVPGPGGTNMAIEGTMGIADLRARHGLRGESLDNFTILWDAQYPAGAPGIGTSAYYAGYWNGTYTSDASMFMVYRLGGGTDYLYDPLLDTKTGVDRTHYLSVGTGSYNILSEESYDYPNSSPWMRVVMTISRIDDNNVRMDIWRNGVKVMSNETKNSSQLRFTEGGWIYLLTDGGNLREDFTVGNNDDRPHPLAQAAIWGFAMTNAEVRLLGTIETDL
jgi:uncharacterized protein YjdB